MNIHPKEEKSNKKAILPHIFTRSINRGNAILLKSVLDELPEDSVGPIHGLILSDIEDKARKIERCSNYVVSGKVDNVEKVLDLKRCGENKLCPVCADKLAGDKIRRMDEALLYNWDNVKNAYMVTFTVPDSDSLHESLEMLKEGWRKFYLMGRNRGDYHSYGEASKILGASLSFEVTKGKNSGKWHPHLHAIVFTDKQLDYTVYNQRLFAYAKKKFPKKGDPRLKEFLVWHHKKTMKYAIANFETRFKSSNTLFNEYIRKHSAIPRHYYNTKGELCAQSKLTEQWKHATEEQGINARVDMIFLTPENEFQKRKYKKHIKPEKYVPFFKNMHKELTGFTEEQIEKQKKKRVFKAVKYSLKYSVKPSHLEDMSAEEIFEMMDTLKNRRMYAFKGMFYGKEFSGLKKMYEARTAKSGIQYTVPVSSVELKQKIDKFDFEQELKRVNEQLEVQEFGKKIKEYLIPIYPLADLSYLKDMLNAAVQEKEYFDFCEKASISKITVPTLQNDIEILENMEQEKLMLELVEERKKQRQFEEDLSTENKIEEYAEFLQNSKLVQLETLINLGVENGTFKGLGTEVHFTKDTFIKKESEYGEFQADPFASRKYKFAPHCIPAEIKPETALFQLGAPEEKKFRQRQAVMVAEYNRNRKKAFELWKMKLNTNQRYIQLVMTEKAKLKVSIKYLRQLRDFEINQKTDYLYDYIINGKAPDHSYSEKHGKVWSEKQQKRVEAEEWKPFDPYKAEKNIFKSIGTVDEEKLIQDMKAKTAADLEKRNPIIHRHFYVDGSMVEMRYNGEFQKKGF